MPLRFSFRLAALSLALFSPMLLPGQQPDPLHTASRQGFETAITVHVHHEWIAVEALDRSNKTLGTSAPHRIVV